MRNKIQEGLCYRCAYPVRSPNTTKGGVFDPALDEFRDGDAFAEFSPWLYEKLGFRYGGLIHNYRGCNEFQAEMATRLTERDVIVLTTRPPLSDLQFELYRDRKVIWPSETDLEQDIFDSIRECFEVCKRSMIVVASPYASRLLDPSLASVEFYQNGSGHCKKFRQHAGDRWEKADDNVTVVFAIVTRCRRYRARLVNVFGMDGTTTLLWCYLLRMTGMLGDLSPRFLMVELRTTPREPGRVTLSHAERWDTRVLLNEPLPDCAAANGYPEMAQV